MQVRNNWFIDEGSRTIVLHRVKGYRQPIMIRVKNNSSVPLMPIIGLGNVHTTVIDTIIASIIQPLGSVVMTIPAEDANGVLFEELFVFLDYNEGNADVSAIEAGLLYSLAQDEMYSILDFFDDRVSGAFPT